MIMVEGSIDFFEIAVGALVLHLYLLIAELFLIQMHIPWFTMVSFVVDNTKAKGLMLTIMPEINVAITIIDILNVIFIK
jgi:hypothetical protein